MARISAIRDRLASYLAGELALADFNQWLAANTWNIHQAGEPDAEELVYAIELRLAEHSAGHLTTADLNRELLTFVARYTIDLDRSRITTKSSDEILRIPLLAVA